MNAQIALANLNDVFSRLYRENPGEQFNCIVTALENEKKQDYPFLVTGYAITAKPTTTGIVQVELWSEIAKVKPAPVMAETKFYVRTSRNVLIAYFKVLEDGSLEDVPLPDPTPDPNAP